MYVTYAKFDWQGCTSGCTSLAPEWGLNRFHRCRFFCVKQLISQLNNWTPSDSLWKGHRRFQNRTTSKLHEVIGSCLRYVDLSNHKDHSQQSAKYQHLAHSRQHQRHTDWEHNVLLSTIGQRYDEVLINTKHDFPWCGQCFAEQMC